MKSLLRFIKTDKSVLSKEQDAKIAKIESDLVTLDKSKKYLERNINDLLRDVGHS